MLDDRLEGGTACNGRALHRTTTLKATHPAVAALWHPSLNGDIGPDNVGAGSGKRTYWLCERGHVSHRVVRSVVGRPTCEECVDRVDDPAESMSGTHPHLAAEFHPTRNGSITPEKIQAGTRLKLWWRCARGHEWPATGQKRVTGAGRCLVCANRRVVPGENDMATTHPELAQELHPSKNHGLCNEHRRRYQQKALVAMRERARMAGYGQRAGGGTWLPRVRPQVRQRTQ